jgi:hypothetical protein
MMIQWSEFLMRQDAAEFMTKIELSGNMIFKGIVFDGQYYVVFYLRM